MSKSDFLAEVRSAFGYLEAACGFRLVRYERPRSFDNAVVDFASPTLHLRVGRERGQVFIEVGASASTRSYDGHLLARMLGDAILESRMVAARTQVGDLGPALEPHIPRITELFGPAEQARTEARLDELASVRADELFGPRAPSLPRSEFEP